MPVQQPEYASLRQGLVGAWCPSLMFGGRILPDASRFGRHAYAQNAISSGAFGSGRMASGDGVSGYYDTFSPCGLAGATRATLSMWFYRPSTSVNFAAGASGALNSGQRFAIESSGTTFYLTAENNAQSYPSFTSSATGLHHIASVFDGTASVKLRCFLDGVDVGGLSAGGNATPASLSSTLGNIRIGWDQDSNLFAAGLLDDIRVYNRALTPAEIRLLASRRGIGLTPTRVRPPLKPVTTVSFSQSASSRRMANATSSLKQGLVGAWCPSLGASGLTLIDRSGKNNHGVLTNMGGQDNWRASGSGVALNFDGTNDYVVGTQAFESTAVTFSLWAYFRTNPTNYPMLLQLRRSGGANATNSVQMLHRPNGDTFGGGSGSRIMFNIDTTGGNTSFPVAALTAGAWVHYCGTYSGSTLSLYVNGVLAQSRTSATGVPTGMNQLNIGNNLGAQSDGYLDGLVDDARIYNRALTPTEIRLLASKRGIGLTDSQVRRPTTQVKPRVTTVAASSRRVANTTSSLRSGLVGAWCPSLGATGYTLLDRSGRNNHGTLLNMGGQNVFQKSGNGLSVAFDGVDDYGTVPHSDKFLASSRGLSVCAWVQCVSASEAVATFVSKGGQTSPENDWSLFYYSGKLQWSCDSTFANAGFAMPLSFAMSFIAGTYDKSSKLHRLFFNGVEVFSYTGTGSGINQQSSVTFGAETENGAVRFKTCCYLDDVRIYDRPLTLSEIRLLASQRGIGLTDSQVRRPAVDAASTLYAKKDGQWVPTIPYTKSNGVWGPATPQVKNGGVWK